MNHGVLFEVNGFRKHSYDDFGLLLAPIDIPFPEVKSKYIEIEGGNGSVDLTETFGKIYYKNRKFSLKFTCNDRLRFDKKINEISSFLHGREVKMFFYYEPEYYFLGRASVNKYTSSKATGTITIDVNVEPYKYKRDVTIETHTVTNKAVITYINDRMEVTPKFKASAEMNFTFNGNSYSLGTTETIFPNIEFTQGDNVIVWTGNGVVSVEYQEGAL